MSIRPWRDVYRREEPQDTGGRRGGRRRRADLGPDHDQYGRRRTPAPPSNRCCAAPRAGADIVRVSCPDEDSTRAMKRDLRRKPDADRRRHPFPLQTRHRGGGGGRRLSPHQSGQYRRGGPGARGDPRGEGQRVLHAHRRQRRIAGETPAGEIRRAVPGGDGRKRARHHIRLLEDNDFLRIQDLLAKPPTSFSPPPRIRDWRRRRTRRSIWA